MLTVEELEDFYSDIAGIDNQWYIMIQHQGTNYYLSDIEQGANAIRWVSDHKKAKEFVNSETAEEFASKYLKRKDHKIIQK